MTTLKNSGLSEKSENTALKLALITGSLFTVVMLLFTNWHIQTLANKPPVPYGFTDSGAQLLITQETPEKRNLRIMNFASKVLVGMYTWGSVIESDAPTRANPNAKKEIRDKGVLVADESGKKVPIPTSSFVATLGIEPNLARATRMQIANYITKHNIGPAANQSTTYFQVMDVSPPIDQGNGRYTVTLVGAQTIKSEGKETVVNHAYTISLRTAPTTQLLDVVKEMKDTVLAQYATAMDAAGLKITNITPIQ